jgi:hypothetical protein
VDNARRMISKNVDIVVTSVLQTTAGKMIFGRFVEAPQPAAPLPPPAPAAVSTTAPQPATPAAPAAPFRAQGGK